MNKQWNNIIITILVIILIIILAALWWQLVFDLKFKKNTLEIENDLKQQAEETEQNQQIIDDKTDNLKEDLAEQPVQEKCIDKDKIEGLANSSDMHLLKLDEYQSVCNSFVFGKHKIFTEMIYFQETAENKAKEMAKTLKEFSKFKVMPVVIVEPISPEGPIDLEKFLAGDYNSWLGSYFAALKSEGITDQMMGVWLPFPEANTPAFENYQNMDIADFALLINQYLSIFKKHFPSAQGSISLDSVTYSTDDLDWGSGQYLSLLPYLSNIEKGLVDSFCLQGFPWSGTAGSNYDSIDNPALFLNSDLAAEAADALGIKEIWFNTGTFSSKYRLSKDRVSVSANKREEILDGILKEAVDLKNRGYFVWINLFAEDKMNSAEETNWSYWSDPLNLDNAHRDIFFKFALVALKFDVTLSLYDSK